MRPRWFLTTLALALSAAPAAAVSLVYGAGGEPVSLDSGTIVDGNSSVVQMQVYDTLVKFKKGTSELAPGLATSWAANKDSTQWTFTLRKGVKFSDGTPFNAAAVVYNINRWWDPAAPDGAKAHGKTFSSWLFTFGGLKGDKASLLCSRA